MAFEFSPSTSVSAQSLNTPQGGQLGGQSGNLLSTLSNLTTIETQQQALDKARATFESDVARSKADSERAQTEAKKSNLDFGNQTLNTVFTVISPYASDKRVLAAENLTPQSSKKDIDAVRNGLLDIGEESIKELVARGIPKSEAYRLVAPHFMETEKDPIMAAQSIKMTVQKLAGAANIAQQNQPQLATVNGQTTTIIPSRGVVPLQGTQQPNPPASPSGETTGVSQGAMNMPQMQYPVRKAGEAYAQLPNEPKDLEDGRSYRSNLISAQLELPKMRRNVDEVLKEAAILEKSAINEGAGFFGKAGREISTFLGTEEGIRYKQLSKDLANAQLTAIQASGGSLNTDAGKQLAAMANGDVTYPPKVLQQIARRTQADMTNLDMQANAAQKFTQLYGDQNINTFKQLWSSNADSKIFELKNIYDNPKLSAKEKDAARIELLGNDRKTLEDFARKWKNIQKLEKTGSL
jgi:hypothetical protein